MIKIIKKLKAAQRTRSLSEGVPFRESFRAVFARGNAEVSSNNAMQASAYSTLAVKVSFLERYAKRYTTRVQCPLGLRQEANSYEQYYFVRHSLNHQRQF